MKNKFALLFFLSFCAAVWPQNTDAKYKRAQKQRHSSVIRCVHPLLCGSRASLEKQNEVADRHNLERFYDNEELLMAKKMVRLVPLPEEEGITVDERLSSERRWCRQWTQDFLLDLGAMYVVQFGSAIQVNSAVRTVADQIQLRKSGNRNAASWYGSLASSHLTGATIDIAKLHLTQNGKHRELGWLRTYLIKLEKQNLIEVTEENSQAIFHIMVFPEYASRNS